MLMNRLVYLENVATLSLDVSRCICCGMCTTVCPHGVFTLREGSAEIVFRDGCMECGACATNCPAEAIQVQTGVGCAAAVINSMLGRTDSSCCCVIESPGPKQSDQGSNHTRQGSGCC